MPFPRELPLKPARVTHNKLPLLVTGGIVASSAIFYWILVKTNCSLLAPRFQSEWDRIYAELHPDDPRRILHEVRKEQNKSHHGHFLMNVDKITRESKIKDPKPTILVLADQGSSQTPPKPE